jgi:hypothetical protein
MKLAVSMAVAAAMTLLPVALRPAAAQVDMWQPGAVSNEFGKPEFPNYLSRDFQLDTCDWWTSAYERACPTAVAPPVVAAPPAMPVKTPR